MRPYFYLVTLAAILLSAQFALADDCENIRDEKICWNDGTETTLSWTYARTTIEGYQIEARDFNWLGSVFLRVTFNNTIREGMISEGEGFTFDFSNDTSFRGIKIIATQVSNINPMPANTGVYPNDPRAKITIKQQDAEDEEIPELGISISTTGETMISSIITAEIEIKNSGTGDLANTDVSIYYDGLKMQNEYDAKGGYLSEGTFAAADLLWENVSKYRLTPAAVTIVRNGFFIEVLNFSNSAIMLRATYNFSSINGTLLEGGSMIFDFSTGEDFRGFKLLGGNFSEDLAELTLQLPKTNVIKRNYPFIYHGNTESVKLSFQIPSTSRKSFTIRVNASGKDSSGKTYNASEQKTIQTSETLHITKRVSDSILGSAIYPESYYMVGGIRSKNEVTFVKIRVDNLQSYSVRGVRLVDTISPGFTFFNDTNSTSISWDFDINASDFREFRYELKARRPGVYNLPNAELYWKEWGEQLQIVSESPKTTVSGPYLGLDRSLNKSSIRIGDQVLVTLTVINNGDVPTNVTIREIVPLNTTFLSGKRSFSGFLNPAETANIAYNISATDVLDFKSPEITSKNTGFEWYAPLPQKRVVVMKAGESVTSSAAIPSEVKTEVTPPETQKGILEMLNEKLPWLEGSVAMLTLIFAVLILLQLNKINRTL